MIKPILDSLTERAIAQEVGTHHDEARLNYSIRRNTVGSYQEFVHHISQYYNHHFSTCLASGGQLSDEEAQERAIEILENHYKKHEGDIVMAYNDARDGTNGGLRAVLDVIADSLRDQSIEYYIRSVFNRYVCPASWEERVEIISQFIDQSGHVLDQLIDKSNPERYARDHQPLIRAYVRGLTQTGRALRRL